MPKNKNRPRKAIPINQQLEILNFLCARKDNPAFLIPDNFLGKIRIGFSLNNQKFYIRYYPAARIQCFNAELYSEFSFSSEKPKELNQTKDHFSLLVTLAHKDKETGSIAQTDKHIFAFETQLGEEGGEGRVKKVTEITLNDNEFTTRPGEWMVKRRRLSGGNGNKANKETAEKEARITKEKFDWMSDNGLITNKALTQQMQMASILVPQFSYLKEFLTNSIIKKFEMEDDFQKTLSQAISTELKKTDFTQWFLHLQQW